MKATMNAHGKLTIKAETDIEHYALAKWWEDWQTHKVCLQVEIAHDSSPNAVSFKTIRNNDG